jgi:hypothetical protein
MSGQEITTITSAAAGDYGYHGGSTKNKTGMYGIIHEVAQDDTNLRFVNTYNSASNGAKNEHS